MGIYQHLSNLEELVERTEGDLRQKFSVAKIIRKEKSNVQTRAKKVEINCPKKNQKEKEIEETKKKRKRMTKNECWQME